jgi:hypothetical protein
MIRRGAGFSFWLLTLLAPAALIAQKPDCAIDGIVVNAVTGQPIARVSVSVGDARDQVMGVTDSQGKWGFSSVTCSSVLMNFRRPGFVQQTWRNAPVRGLEIRLMPNGVITGKVVDDQGDPVQNTYVQALPSTVVEGARTFGAPDSTTTNDLGEYRLPVTPGKHVVCARAQGTLPLPIGVTTIFNDRCTPEQREIPPGVETHIDFTLVQVPAVHVRGTVAGLPEGVGVGVLLTRVGSDQRIESDRNAAARPGSGTFDIPRVAPGSYIMHASLTRGDLRLVGRMPIEVGPAGLDGVTFHLEPAVTVSGTIRAESKTDFPSRKPVRLLLRSFEQLVPSRTIESNDVLKFALADVAPGAYRLSVLSVPSPFYVKSATIAGRDVLNQEFTLSQTAGPIEVVLRDDGGAIQAETDGPAAMVIALGEGRTSIARPDGQHYMFENLAPGDYSVYAFDGAQVEYADPEWMKHYAGSSVKVTVGSGQTVQAKLTAQKIP